ncbi:MAG: TldD/PmbA family protein [Candidatus Undinarchaeales archaeon]|jgi:predicted Zn-dependent protease|nr:TldD/PmbA family protein [Candidatus Undinarchaeales archaeon]
MMVYEIHGDMAPKMEAVGKIADQYAEMGVYLSLTIEENASSTYVAADGELNGKGDSLMKGARVHVVAQDQTGMSWEAYGITQDTTKDGLEKLADYAVKNISSPDSIRNISSNLVSGAASGVYLSIPRKILAYENTTKVEDHYEAKASKSFDSVSAKEKQELVEGLSKSAMQDGIVKSRGIYAETERKSWFADSNGSRITQIIPRPYAGISATAQKDDPAYEDPVDFTNFDSFGLGSGGYELVAKALAEKDATARGKEVAETALKVINGERYDSGATTVVMDGQMAGVFIHEALGHMTEADHYTQHDSRILKGKLGEQIAVDGLNVVDDGRALERSVLSGKARGSFKYDDEGTPSQRTELIKDGVLTNFLMGNNEASIYAKKEFAKYVKENGMGDGESFDLAKEIADAINKTTKDFARTYMEENEGIKDPTEEAVLAYINDHGKTDEAFIKAYTPVMQEAQTGLMTKIASKAQDIQAAWEKADKHEYAPTGNARAEAWYAVPQVRMTNTMILPNKEGPNTEGMVKDVKDGIYMTGSWGGYVELNGNFAFWPKEAYKIEDGEIKYDKPIKGTILMDNTLKALKNISSIGNGESYERFGGTCGKGGQGVPNECSGPAIRIDDIVVQGTPHDKVGHQAIRKEIKDNNGMYLGPETEIEAAGYRQVDKIKTPWKEKTI